MLRSWKAAGPCARAVTTLALLGGALLLPLATAPRSSAADAGAHPLYDDGNTLRWYTSLAEARKVAAREGKLILVDVSLRDCRTCEMVIGLAGDPAIRSRLSRIAIGHHVDARAATPFARDFHGNLRSAAYLPWVGFFSAGQAWISGFAPSQRTTVDEMRRRFLVALGDAEAELRDVAARRAAAAAPAPAVRPAPTPTADAGGTAGLVWHRRISDAQRIARAEGRIIFVTSTKPNCSLCKKLMDDVTPQVWSELSKGCVLYVYDILAPEHGQIDRTLRANLEGAYIMPLAGFVSADLKWLHGFFGSTDAQKLAADYRTARRRR